MDPSSSDLEFFDFKNSSDEEIKEIQAILKGPGSNGCVELPWEISVKEISAKSHSRTEGEIDEGGPSAKLTKALSDATIEELNFSLNTELPIAQLPQPPPTIDAFVTLPTTVGLYQNAPYFVSRTIPACTPYLRPYPPMGVPFFACPMPGAGDTNPYGQFIPLVPPPTEKLDLELLETESNSKTIESQTQINKRSKKILSGTDAPENGDSYLETPGSTLNTAPVSVGPTSVPLVPLSVPHSTFAVAGYPAGLHTLPYPGQASSPAMYYVPVFNHPYGGYLPSAPMMMPGNVAELDKCSPQVTEIDSSSQAKALERTCIETVPKYSSLLDENNSGTREVMLESDNSEAPIFSSQVTKIDCQEAAPTCSLDKPAYFADDLPGDGTTNVQSDCQIDSTVEVSPPPASSTAKTNVSGTGKHTPLSETFETEEQLIDSSLSSSEPLSEGSSPSYLPKKIVVEKISDECSQGAVSPKETVVQVKMTEKVKQVTRDPSRCWADLFKGPCEVNGIDRHLPNQKQEKRSTFKKDVSNGKAYSVPENDGFH